MINNNQSAPQVLQEALDDLANLDKHGRLRGFVLVADTDNTQLQYHSVNHTNRGDLVMMLLSAQLRLTRELMEQEND